MCLVLSGCSSVTGTGQEYLDASLPLTEGRSYFIDDTLAGPIPVLVGSVALPMTPGQLQLMNYGIMLRGFSESPCMNEGMEPPSGSDHITGVQRSDNVLTITVQVSAYCGAHFLADAFVQDESILVLNYMEYGSWASCECCYGLTYVFELDDEPYEVPPVFVKLMHESKPAFAIPSK